MTTPKSDRDYYMFALRVVGDFGINIAVPVVGLALLGDYLDEKYGWTPVATISGFVLAAIISGMIIYRKAKQFGQEYQRLTQNKSQNKDQIKK